MRRERKSNKERALGGMHKVKAWTNICIRSKYVSSSGKGIQANASANKLMPLTCLMD